MTIITPNSIAGVTSLTALGGSIDFYNSDGTLSGLNINGVNVNTAGIVTAGIVSATSFYGDGITINASGIVTAGIVSATSFYGDGSNLTGVAATTSLTIGRRTTAYQINAVGTGITVSLRSGIGTLNF